MNKWTDPQEWARMIPDLSCDCPTSSKPSHPLQGGESLSALVDEKQSTKNLINDGYTLINKQPTNELLANTVAAGISTLHKTYKLPATFILLYDQAWQLAATGTSILQNTTHSKNVFNFDVLAWYIDPSDGAAGFSPHRDRQPTNEEVAASFHQDEQAKYVTLWMALSDATPENSCIYVIPKQHDPGYLEGDDEEDTNMHDQESHQDYDAVGTRTCTTQDPLTRCLKSKESYQNIRALPRRAGESIAFTHRIIHWGSRGNSNCTEPRIAISFVTSDPSFEKPYLRQYEKYWKPSTRTCTGESVVSGGGSASTDFSSPPFYVRLLLVCAQLIIYYQRFNLPQETIRACYEYCKGHKEELEESYWKKVSFEFVNAMKEGKVGAKQSESENEENQCTSKETKEDNRGKNDDDDDDEALLEAMLEHINEVEDDFDEMNYGEETGVISEDEDFDNDEEDCYDLFAPANRACEPCKKKSKK